MKKKTIVVSEVKGDLGIIMISRIRLMYLPEYVNKKNYRKYMSKKYMKKHSSKKHIAFVFRGG